MAVRLLRHHRPHHLIGFVEALAVLPLQHAPVVGRESHAVRGRSFDRAVLHRRPAIRVSAARRRRLRRVMLLQLGRLLLEQAHAGNPARGRGALPSAVGRRAKRLAVARPFGGEVRFLPRRQLVRNDGLRRMFAPVGVGIQAVLDVVGIERVRRERVLLGRVKRRLLDLPLLLLLLEPGRRSAAVARPFSVGARAFRRVWIVRLAS
mmetsp:Transcript_24172/g.51799  ORF Transcript_24172/g.51799 Transcript_24172/m.51799 type:complete len:206 (+) Transcript_24172:238-855(+)